MILYQELWAFVGGGGLGVFFGGGGLLLGFCLFICFGLGFGFVSSDQESMLSSHTG